jgi:hypothetical protein
MFYRPGPVQLNTTRKNHRLNALSCDAGRLCSHGWHTTTLAVLHYPFPFFSYWARPTDRQQHPSDATDLAVNEVMI